ncbi:hypothetical protein Geob_1993 [Geotalea daltonii FRC-32]|uniref:Uncharacterized protein n=1 Tax=Geotalea daltonii (strain DSM 22248 / JCM 15807 / FRC-32) TaxID=316067 RepID=B9M884_GEODF|nr:MULTISPECIES: hypothetical protein [Geotalea]ACM20350.1 hypothetical protein Geob_1993 [Geotalea daltonii FRC-32]
MKSFIFRFLGVDFSELDRQIDKLRELRDSYREANIRHYGSELAALLND